MIYIHVRVKRTIMNPSYTHTQPHTHPDLSQSTEHVKVKPHISVYLCPHICKILKLGTFMSCLIAVLIQILVPRHAVNPHGNVYRSGRNHKGQREIVRSCWSFQISSTVHLECILCNLWNLEMCMFSSFFFFFLFCQQMRKTTPAGCGSFLSFLLQGTPKLQKPPRRVATIAI